MRLYRIIGLLVAMILLAVLAFGCAPAGRATGQAIGAVGEGFEEFGEGVAEAAYEVDPYYYDEDYEEEYYEPYDTEYYYYDDAEFYYDDEYYDPDQVVVY
jgi:hypothetical protein